LVLIEVLKPSKLTDSDLTSLPPLDGEFVTTSAVAFSVMVPEINQTPLVAESMSIDTKIVKDEPYDVGGPVVNTISSWTNVLSDRHELSLTRVAIPPLPVQLEVHVPFHESVTEEEEDVIELAEDDWQFLLHNAVIRSKTFMDAIEGTSSLDDNDPNAPMDMDAVLYATATRTTLSVPEYGYCLGYKAVGNSLPSMMANDEAPLERLL
jgi:hypothetical protein